MLVSQRVPLDNGERTALQYLLEGSATRTDFGGYLAGAGVSNC